jgi:putative heme iron utilization protein
MTAPPDTPRPDPIRPTDDAARTLARDICASATFGALGVIDPETRGPMVSRVAVLWHGGAVLVLVSDLSLHTAALRQDPACSLLLGEPGPKGDPLTHPRLTLLARAEITDKAALRTAWLARHPKAALYYGFADFRMWRLSPRHAHLNGGFGKAYRLTPADLDEGPTSAAFPAAP